MRTVVLQAALSRIFPISNCILEIPDFVPCLETAAHQPKVELLHMNERLVHVQQNVPGNLLLFKDIAMLRINTKSSQIVGCLFGIPLLDVGFCWAWILFA